MKDIVGKLSETIQKQEAEIISLKKELYDQSKKINELEEITSHNFDLDAMVDARTSSRMPF